MGDENSNYREFDDGRFCEEDMRVLKRMLPSSFVAEAKRYTRKDFFSYLRNNLSTGNRIAGPMRRTLYKMQMSKRNLEIPETKKGPLSQRDV